MRVWHPRAPALRFARPPPFTVGRGPVPRHASIGKTVLVGVQFSRGLTLAGETLSDARMASEGPRATVKKTPPFTVGRGPVPRHASIERKTPFVGVRFLRGSNDRGGQAPALRYARPPPFTVGRGPVPRRASVDRETALVGVRFSRGSTIAGDRPPRYGEKTCRLP